MITLLNYSLIINYSLGTQMKQMGFLVLLIWSALSTDYIYINGPTTRIRGYTSESIELTNPFSRQFFLDVPKQQDKSLFSFQANHLRLESKYSIYMGSKAKTVLESLRTPSTQDYRQILVFDDFVMVLKELNEVEIVSYNKTGFTKKSSFIIKDIKGPTVFFKAYKYKNKALLFANTMVFLLSGQGFYDLISFPQGSQSVAYAQWIQGTDNILLAQYGLGLGIYKIQEDSKRAIRTLLLDYKFFAKQYISIEDINIDKTNQSRLFVLDRFSGVHKVNFNLTDPEKTSHQGLIVQNRGCYAMDEINFDYLVLSCQYQTENYLTEVILNENGTSSIMKPLFKDEYVVDVEVAPDYYMSLSRKIINVYWNSKKNHMPEEYRFANNLILPGLQVISLSTSNKHDLFVISNNILTKYQLVQTPPKIYFKSSVPIQSTIPVSIYGSCESFNKSLVTKNLDPSNQFCVFNTEYEIYIVQPNKPQKSDMSASISIIIILFVVLGILVWICIKKYTQIEEQARRMLQEFQKRNPHNHIAL